MRKHIAVAGAGAVGGDLGGRRTEIDELNGLIVQKAKDAGCPAPTHERIVEIVRRIERGAVTPRPELLFDA